VNGMDGYSVGDLARIARVSVRTLHHYDAIGLLTPSGRTAGGYRQYSDTDVVRLHQIRFYRSLGFALEAIAEILADPDVTAEEHLRRQHRLLRERIAHDQDLVRSIEKEMEAREMGIALTPEERFEMFGEHHDEWAAEAEERWGDTDAYRESARRTAAYTKEDWTRMKAQADATLNAFAEVFRSGASADSVDAMAIAEEHRQHITRWFYDCSYDIHRGLAEMYVADERFRAHYDEVAEGLAGYVHDAIVANADRAGAAEGTGND
jgi:MerR family transcriptional regulator, thiopeptide resistance regulator